MKKGNKRKTNLKSTLLLLLLALILFISSSYAWFTSNQTVTVNPINVKVVAKNGLQISTDANVWKSVVTTTEIAAGYTGHTNQFPDSTVNAAAELQPCSTDGTVETTDATTKGQMNIFLGTVAADTADDGKLKLTTTKEKDTAGSTGNYIAFDLFLKVDTSTDIYLTTGSKVLASGASKGLENAARVALINEGTTENNGTVIADARALNSGTASIIWEPNYTSHTASGIANAISTYGITDAADGTGYDYRGISTPVTSVLLNGLTNDNSKQMISSELIKYRTVKEDMPNTSFDAKLFTLDAGVTKVRIYMWVEGQDFDCENQASGSGITMDLQFSTSPSSADEV